MSPLQLSSPGRGTSVLTGIFSLVPGPPWTSANSGPLAPAVLQLPDLQRACLSSGGAMSLRGPLLGGLVLLHTLGRAAARGLHVLWEGECPQPGSLAWPCTLQQPLVLLSSPCWASPHPARAPGPPACPTSLTSEPRWISSHAASWECSFVSTVHVCFTRDLFRLDYLPKLHPHGTGSRMMGWKGDFCSSIRNRLGLASLVLVDSPSPPWKFKVVAGICVHVGAAPSLSVLGLCTCHSDSDVVPVTTSSTK